MKSKNKEIEDRVALEGRRDLCGDNEIEVSSEEEWRKELQKHHSKARIITAAEGNYGDEGSLLAVDGPDIQADAVGAWDGEGYGWILDSFIQTKDKDCIPKDNYGLNLTHNPLWCGGDENGQCVPDDPCWTCIFWLGHYANSSLL